MPVHHFPGQRLFSLDFFRGLIMVLLMLEASGFYDHMIRHAGETFWIQFTHHPWHGLRFWDLIQPGFMFIAGTAMAFSLEKQWFNGRTWHETFMKMLKRSGWLFFWGVLNYAVRSTGLSFELWNVLTQLSFTLLVAFLIYRWTAVNQILFSAGLLLLTEILYRFTDVPGFDQPFTDQMNFGNYVDLLLMNKINSGGWVAINCLPTAAHTIWGAVAGKVLMSGSLDIDKIKWLSIAGVVCLGLGYLLDLTMMTPIIKRIATTSFTLASGGWCILALALFYWWIDVRDHKKYLSFFTVVGMNAIFIYLFFEIVGHRWFNEYIGAISHGLLQFINVSESFIDIFTSLVIFALEWGLCYFLYNRNIFFKL